MKAGRAITLAELDALFERFASAIEAARQKAHEGVDAQFDAIQQQQERDYQTLRAAALAGELLAPPDFESTQALAERGNARTLQ